MIYVRLAGFLVLVGVLAPAAAQPLLPDSLRDAPSTAVSSDPFLELLRSDEGRPAPALTGDLVHALGRPWTEIRQALPPPDSSSFEHDLGDVWWSVPGSSIEGIRAFVQNGRVESVMLDLSSAGPDLAALARRFYEHLGSPRADGFYATDQTGFPFSLAIDAQVNRLTVRAVPGQVLRDGARE